VQLVAPVDDVYFPRAHVEQVPPPVKEYDPAAHGTINEHVAAPAAEICPDGQIVHVDDEAAPVATEKVPAEQLVQPTEALVAENLPTGQVTQLAEPMVA